MSGASFHLLSIQRCWLRLFLLQHLMHFLLRHKIRIILCPIQLLQPFLISLQEWSTRLWLFCRSIMRLREGLFRASMIYWLGVFMLFCQGFRQINIPCEIPSQVMSVALIKRSTARAFHTNRPRHLNRWVHHTGFHRKQTLSRVNLKPTISPSPFKFASPSSIS